MDFKRFYHTPHISNTVWFRLTHSVYYKSQSSLHTLPTSVYNLALWKCTILRYVKERKHRSVENRMFYLLMTVLVVYKLAVSRTISLSIKHAVRLLSCRRIERRASIGSCDPKAQFIFIQNMSGNVAIVDNTKFLGYKVTKQLSQTSSSCRLSDRTRISIVSVPWVPPVLGNSGANT